MGNFLDEAEDVTEEVGFKSPKAKKDSRPKKASNFLEEAEDLGEAPAGSGADVDISTFEKVMNVLDIPGSIGRTAVEAAISPKRDVIPAVAEQISQTIKSPTTAPSQAPTGTDILKTAIPDINQESLGTKVAGFGVELVTDPTNFFAPFKSVTKPIRKALTSASERQAAKAVAKYATKPGVLKEGVDIEQIGQRLVAEDLQGELRDPKKLYEKISGNRHLTKVNPDSIDTLQIKRGEFNKGLIAETSDSISSAIKSVEEAEGLSPVVPANIMGKALLDKIRVNLSKTSGESYDLNAVEKTLEKVLKPFQRKAVPLPPKKALTQTDALMMGITSDEALKNIRKSKFPEGGISPLQFEGEEIPTTLKLSELHQLRKNIGKLVADRAFYATPDQAMRTETEVLRDLYRELGDVIKTQLDGKQVRVGNTLVDAGQFYQAQNNRLKSMLDLQSMLEYVPTEQLKDPDMAANIAAMVTKGSIYGGTAAAASLAGLPVPALSAGLLGAGYGVASSAADMVKSSTPEYLTSIFKQMGNVADTRGVAEAVTRGGIIMGRPEGEFNSTAPTEQSGSGMFKNVKPAFPFGVPPEEQIKNIPKSGMISPKQLLKYRIPASTEGILNNKEMVLAKIAQAGVPSEMYETIAYTLNENPEKIGDIAPLVMAEFPTLFEGKKYKMFDGVILDPADRAKAADDVSKRDDIGSLQKSKIIRELNRSGKWLGE